LGVGVGARVRSWVRGRVRVTVGGASPSARLEQAQRSVRAKLSTSCGEKVTVTCIASPAAMVPSCGSTVKG